MPSCPAGWLFSSPHRPVLRTGGERGGAPSQHCSCPLAREEAAGGGGTERTGGRGGYRGYRGLEPNQSGLEPSSSLQLLPHSPDFLPSEWCLLGFPPLFSHQLCDRIRSLDPLVSTSLPCPPTASFSVVEPVLTLDLPLFSSILGAPSRSAAGRECLPRAVHVPHGSETEQELRDTHRQGCSPGYGARPVLAGKSSAPTTGFSLACDVGAGLS